jgi:hypothetical protein
MYIIYYIIILPVLMFADTDLRPQGSDIESDEDEDMEDDDTGPPQDRQGNPGIPSVRCVSVGS